MNDNLVNIIKSFDKRYDEINQKLNCFTLNLSDFALTHTGNQSIDDKGILYGKLIGIKDNINIKGFPTTCSSQILENHTSLYSATVIDRILKEDGLIVAKTNMDDFAIGSSNVY